MIEERNKVYKRIRSYGKAPTDACSAADDKEKLKDLRKKVKIRLREIEEESTEKLIEDIENTKSDSQKMFKAVKVLKMSQKSSNIRLKDQRGNDIHTEKGKVDLIKDYFAAQFKEEKDDILENELTPKPLNCPITLQEVKKAIKKLKTNTATGPDDLENELIKHAGPDFAELLKDSYNQSFEKGTIIESVGRGYMNPIPKPKKNPSVENMRPIILLNSVRKIFSMITLKRIEDKIDEYTGPSQQGYKREEGCADIVWCQKILTSVLKRKKWRFHKMSIDMSRAFDTIKRSVIINLLRDAGCSEDDIRLVKSLVTDTKLSIKIRKTVSGEFETTLGSFQGDCLSGKLFTLYLAGCINHMRAVLGTKRPMSHINDHQMPIEMAYVDDVDFIDENKDTLQEMLGVVHTVFQKWNLKVNTGKTEFTDFYISNEKEQRGNEDWRKNTTLGSKICSIKDIEHRISLSNIAFKKLTQIWTKKTTLMLETKLKVYKAMITPILLYNCCTWAAPKYIMEKVEACQRNHLRILLKIRFPEVINNDELYKRTNMKPLKDQIDSRRWRMLGKILRQDENKPAQNALMFAISNPTNLRARKGRPQINLLDELKKDAKQKGMKLESIEDILELRTKAKNEVLWNQS